MTQHLPPNDALEHIKTLIRDVPDFPLPGILFKDIMPLFQEPASVRSVIDMLTAYIEENFSNVDAIVGLDARGFLFGPSIAMNLNKPFLPIRKKGKLPGKCHSVESTKEYGKDILEVQSDALKPGQNVVIIDDLLATGGTMGATCRLIASTKANVIGCLCVIELADLNGRAKFDKPFHALITY